MGKKFSYSRLGCFNDCRRKYFLKYMEGWMVEKDTQVLSDVTAKGLAFHEFAENYDPKWTREQVIAEVLKYEEQYKEGKAFYPLLPKVDKFLGLYKTNIAPYIEGGSVKKETWLEGNILGEDFCGAIDLLIEHGGEYIPGKKGLVNDGRVEILDYKSAKTATASNYKGQLLLYAYMYAKMNAIPIEGIEDRVSLLVFFPFSQGETSEECLKKIKYTSKDVLENVAKIEKEILDIRSVTWENNDPLDVSLRSTCSWCEFIGHPEFCPITYKAGWRIPRGTKFSKKENK